MDKMRCILKYMVAVLFMVIMMCCIGTSFTVYAAGEWTVDGNGKNICNAAMLVRCYVNNGGEAYKKVQHGKYSVCVEGMYGMAMYKKDENPATKEVEDAAYSLPESLVKSENPSLTGEELDKKRVFKYFTTLRSFVKECSERGISVADRDGATGTANYKWIQSCARYFSISEEHYHYGES